MIESGQAPSVELWRALVGLDPAALSEPELEAAIGAWERVMSCAQACQDELLVAWDRVELPQIDWSSPGSRDRGRVESLALALGLSAQAVAARLDRAATVVVKLPRLHEALRCGQVTVGHAGAAAKVTRHVPPSVARAADAAVMADDGWRTPSQLERALAAQVLRCDPDGGARRHELARQDRQVSARDQPDGMGSIWALLPAQDTQAVIRTLDACAVSSAATSTAGDGRTLAQRRADALVELVTGSSSWSAAVGATDPAAGGPCTCGGTTSNQGRRRRTDVQVTVAWSTLIGLDDAPAVLTGYGPIDAATGRRIAADPSAVWRRLLVDPGSGRLLDYGRNTYRPPADLREFVVARDMRCRFPTCDRPAVVCELDHREPFDHHGDGRTGGATCPGNTDPLCARHHRLKHEAGWSHHRDPDTGDSIWTDPRGRTYRKPATRLPTPPPVEPPVPRDTDLDDPPP